MRLFFSFTFYWLIISTLHSQDIPSDPEAIHLDTLIAWVENNVSNISDTNESMKAYDYAFIALRRAKADNMYRKAAEIHQSLATWHYMHVASEMTDSILYHDRQAYEYYSMIGDKRSMAKASVYISQSLLGRNEYEESEQFLFNALKIFEEVDDKQEQAYTLRNLSSHFILMEKYEDAVIYSEKAEGIYEQLDIPDSYAISLFSSVPAYLKLGRIEDASQKAERSIALIQSMGADQDKAAYAKALGARASVYQKMERFDRALEDYHQAWDVVKALVNEEEEADGWKQGIAEVLHLKKDYSSAIPYFEDFLSHMSERNNSDRLWETQLLLAECYDKTGQRELALDQYLAAWSGKENMLNAKIAQMNTELQIQYETAKKDETITGQQNVIDQQRQIQYMVFSILGLLGIILGGLGWTFLKNKKVNRQLATLNESLEEKNERNEVLLKEIHHRVKNNLQIISSLLSLQSRTISDAAVKEAIIDSESRVRSMSLIHKKLYKGADLTAIEMRSYLEALSDNLIDAYAAHDEDIAVNINMPTIEIDAQYAIPLGLIANELITNSLKYAFQNTDEGTIDIGMKNNEHELVLVISDNGQSSGDKSDDQGMSGFGSSLIQMLTKQLNGQIKQETKMGYSTEVRIPHIKSAA